MAKSRQQLLLKIEQQGRVSHHRMGPKDLMTIGRHPRNDITVHSDRLPRRHVLFAGKNSHFQLSLTTIMHGDVYAGDSHLALKDLFKHDLLHQKGKAFVYPVTNGKKGIIHVGDARITFQCTEAEKVARVKRPAAAEFSWWRASAKDLARDLPFKVVLLFFFVAHAFLLNYVYQIPTDALSKPETAQVPQRLARIIVKKTEIPETPPPALTPAGAEEEAEPDLPKPNRAKKGNREVRPESQGLLGLLTGSGTSNQDNSLADFLLDEGLVQELDEVMASSDLQVGKGKNSGDKIDELLAISELGGGIDDILEDIGSNETVGLSEKGQIQLDRVGTMTGTEQALGERSEESVRNVMLRYSGRLTYIYNKYLKHAPGLAGKIVVEVVIAADGTVSGVSVLSSTVNHAEFEREIINFIRKWKYDPIDTGSVSVSYPLFFNKVG